MAGRFCSACGTPADAGESRYCARCGNPLLAGPFVPPPPILAPGLYPPTNSPRTPSTTGKTVAVVLGVGVVVLLLFASVFLAVRPITPGGPPCCPGSYFPAFPTVVVPQGTNYALAPGGYVDALLVANQSRLNGSAGNVSSAPLTQLFGIVESAGSTPVVALVLTASEFSNWSAHPGTNVTSIFEDRASGSELVTLQVDYPTALAYLVLWDPSANQSGVVTVIESVTVAAFSPPPPVPV